MTRGDQATASDMDSMFDALSNRYRRRVLVALLTHDPQDDDPQLPADVVLDGEERETLPLEMHHAHLPKLAELEFVEWDDETNAVSKGSQFEEIEPLLELLQNHPDELPDDWR